MSKVTKAEGMKKQIIKMMNKLLNEFEKNGKATDRMFIDHCKQKLREFKSYTPEIFIYVEGGNVQGASATEPMTVILFDKDNYMVGVDGSQEDFIANFGTPEDWDKKIRAKTKAKELVDIY